MSPEGAPGHDVMVVVSGKIRSIEVKTRQFLRRREEITRWPVDMAKKGDANFFFSSKLTYRACLRLFIYGQMSRREKRIKTMQEAGIVSQPMLGDW